MRNVHPLVPMPVLPVMGRYTAQVAAQAAPKLTLLKAKLHRSRSKQELLDGGSGLPPSGRAGSGGVVRGPTRCVRCTFVLVMAGVPLCACITVLYDACLEQRVGL